MQRILDLHKYIVITKILKKKIEEYNPLFVVDEDLEGCAPDSKFVIEKMVQQLNLRVVKHCLGVSKTEKYFLDPPFIEMVFRTWIGSS